MAKGNTSIRPVFLWLLWGSLLLSLAAVILLPEPRTAREAKFKVTRVLQKRIADSFEERIAIGGPTNSETLAIWLIGTNSFGSEGTNSQREVDGWGTPFQIEIVARTNLVIRSAGPNRSFGDKDDIVFRSE